jgi:hypothetical protein
MRAARSILTLIAVLAVQGTLGGPARASVVVALGFDELATQAHRVVLGTVSAVDSRWTQRDGERSIATTIDIAVETELSGVSAGPVARIVQPGGRIGDTALVVTGMPEFVEGERVLVFLRGTGADEQGRTVYAVVGMAQGKFAVLPRLGGGFDAVQQLGTGLALAAADEDGAIRTTEGTGPIHLDLDEALARIRKVRGEVTP